MLLHYLSQMKILQGIVLSSRKIAGLLYHGLKLKAILDHICRYGAENDH